MWITVLSVPLFRLSFQYLTCDPAPSLLGRWLCDLEWLPVALHFVPRGHSAMFYSSLNNVLFSPGCVGSTSGSRTSETGGQIFAEIFERPFLGISRKNV